MMIKTIIIMIMIKTISNLLFFLNENENENDNDNGNENENDNNNENKKYLIS